MIARRLLVLVIVMFLAAVVVRNAAVAGFSETRPDLAALFWARHPDTELTMSMTDIARSARMRKPVGSAVFKSIGDAARKEPLSPVPFLVRGVQAQLAGDGAIAERAFIAAQWRDPRSLPAAYFLADRYFRTGDARHGLRQVAALARLAPNGPEIVGPYVAQYARDRRNWNQLHALFRSNARLAEAALQVLARDPRNADAVLALSRGQARAAGSQWLSLLVQSLSSAGQYPRAYAIWSAVGGVKPAASGLIYDASFSEPDAPPPFNWTLTSSPVGLAAREPGGRLHLLFYGQQDGVLASELLLLQPGVYRLSMELIAGGPNPQAISWSIRCDKAAQAIASAPINTIAARGWTFKVPAGCGAQWLELVGTSAELPQQTDVMIRALRLERVGSGG